MSDLTFSAIAIALFLVTPALPFFFWLRLTLPPTRVLLGSDFLLILASSLISLAVNISMFAWLANDFAVRTKVFGLRSPSIELEVANMFQVDGAIEPWRPGHRLLEWLLGVSVPRSNLISFVADLHIRTFIAGLAGCIAIKLFTELQEYYEYLPYSRSCCGKFLACVFGTGFKDNGSRYIVEKERYGRWFLFPLFLPFWLADKARSAFYHPWTQITSYNPKREILIADVLTKEGSIYSGVLMGWVPGEADIQSISLQYILRFLPDMEDVHRKDPEDSESKQQHYPNIDASLDKKDPKKPERTRRKSLIKNNGELTIPGSELCTIHIWEIRRFFVAEIPVKSHQDLSIVKWYVLLAAVEPEFISKIRVQFDEHLEDPASLFDELMSWLDETKLAEEIGKPDEFFDFIGLEQTLGKPEGATGTAGPVPMTKH
jgi:hypothetical protein